MSTQLLCVQVNYTGGVKGLRDMVGNANIAGLWTWSRGDGNYGPYTKAGELWQTVNCRVLAAWANDTSRTEEDLFLETVSADWSLSASDGATLRKIALAAEQATLLGRYVLRGGRIDAQFKLEMVAGFSATRPIYRRETARFEFETTGS
jgi:hypothetical protein